MTTISILVFGLAVRRLKGRKIIFQMALMGMVLSLLLLTVSLADSWHPAKRVSFIISYSLIADSGFYWAIS
ncbi:hypothetical protein [Peribacillus frigoritolerans]|uniref:hypothetical protein n=1 Tax=Peribacillus frigoritolerans TaxID=450367 RepID=UPI0025A24266|nr:hypothetical protein [Peribacillus frigoritolerans]MDM5307408.1 hypothetical protein [Peribacillus frigoritolerans]